MSLIRILHVVTHMNCGGLETMLMNYYHHIDKTKIQFDFLTHREYLGDYGDEIESMGGRIFHLPSLNPINLNYRRNLRKFFREHKEYKIVHVHQDCMSGVILREAAIQNVPVRIAHAHACSQDKDWKYPIKALYRRWIPKYATILMACGEDAGKWMFCGAPFKVLNNAIEAKKCIYNVEIRKRMREELAVPEGTLLMGHVGSFCVSKNQEMLVDLLEEMNKNIDTMLILVGDGELRETVEIKTTKKGLNSKVIFTGLRDDVPNLLQAMDVFIMPSLYEGVSLAVIEAQAAGLQCLISDKVSIECNITGCVTQIPLEAPLETWAESVGKVRKKERENTYEKIASSGYDIEENALRLQDFYMKVNEGYTVP